MERLDPVAWEAVQTLFDALVELSPDAQERHLTDVPHSSSITGAVRDLLRAARQDGILDMTPPSLMIEAPSECFSSLDAGQTIGGFTVEKLIGRGGLGEVYLARRATADFEQRVALKLLRIDAGGRAESFARERRLLARLDHPGIARFIDAGVTPDARPFIAMDYIDGQPIDRWCQAESADLDTRLALFRDVCDAVAYAHGNLVVHRDIKPSNILIDAGGKPRLLDFGIATMLDKSAALPATTQAMLTPDYAAPEQLDGDEATVATDVYALGVVLYELLSGRSPWRSGKTSVPVMIRRILNEDAQLPSRAVIRESGISARQIAGDLDAIVMKAMRRNPDGRYHSVSELTEDIARHQQCLPVSARAGSTRYMLGRFLRRYRWGVAATGAIIAALLVGAAGIAWQARQTAIERDVALAEMRRSDAVRRMITLMFRNARDQTSGSDISVKQMLDNAAGRLIASVDKSGQSALLVNAIAELYIQVDDQIGAEILLDKALENRAGSDDRVALAEMRLKLSSVKAIIGKADDAKRLLALAEPVFLADRQRFRAEMLDMILVQSALSRLDGHPEASIPLIMQSLPEAEIVFAENHRELLRRYNSVAVLMLDARQLDGLPAIFARTEAMLKLTGQEQSVEALNLLQQKGIYHYLRGDFARSAMLLDQAVDIRRRRFGPSGGLAIALLNLGKAKLALGQPAEAKAILSEAHDLAIRYLGPRDRRSVSAGAFLKEAVAQVKSAKPLADKVQTPREGVALLP